MIVAIPVTQTMGIVAVFILFKVISMTIWLPIFEEEERLGVDIVEHGAHACNDFQTMS